MSEPGRAGHSGRSLVIVIGVVVVALVAALIWLTTRTHDARPTEHSASTVSAGPASSPSGPVPARVTRTLALIDAGQWPAAAHAPGTHGGTTFRNNENHLPATDAQGNRITYREWDVNAKQPGRGRDAERIVTGSDGSAWYTLDHYQDFVMIRGPSR